MHTEKSVTHFLGVNFSNISEDDAISVISGLSQSESFNYIVTPNVDHVVMLHDGKSDDVTACFRGAYESAALRLCDSRILQLLAKIRGIELEVVTGSDLTARLFEHGLLDGKAVAIIGGDQAMVPELMKRFPRVSLVQHIPPMGVLKNHQAIEDIEAFVVQHLCDYVIFAIGAPQSEIIARQCFEAGRAKGVAICVGASLEFILGRKARAPVWVQSVRSEWLFRMLCEPRRLWRRYLLTGPKIFRIVWKSR